MMMGEVMGEIPTCQSTPQADAVVLEMPVVYQQQRGVEQQSRQRQGTARPPDGGGRCRTARRRVQRGSGRVVEDVYGVQHRGDVNCGVPGGQKGTGVGYSC